MNRKEQYQYSESQIIGLLEGEGDLIANISNVAAVLKENLGFFWVGFYFVKENELVLGPFQGPVACTRIAFGKGVCGTSWKDKTTILVRDVHEFPGHIACSPESNSEIVVPVFDKSGNVMAVLDIDSTRVADFTEIDQIALENIANLITAKHG